MFCLTYILQLAMCSCALCCVAFKVNFLLRKIFRRNLNAAISLVEIDITLKVASISAM